MKKTSAGLLVYREKDGQVEVLLAHPGGPFWAKKDLGAWSIPKGIYEGDEDPKDAAYREFEEEIGQSAPFGEAHHLGDIEQKNNKNVMAWAIEGDIDTTEVKSNTFEMEWPPRSGKKQEFPEVDRAQWFSLSQAAQKLNPDQVPFLERLAEFLKIDFKQTKKKENTQQQLL